MAIVTTKSIADPKPVRPIDWTGNPLADGAQYAGGDERFQDTVSRGVETPVARPDQAAVSQPRKRRRKRGIMTAEWRQFHSEKMRAYWARKRGVTDMQSVDTPSNDQSVGT